MMKRTILLVMAFMFALTVSAQDSVMVKKDESVMSQKQGAQIEFENETIDYGTIAHNSDGKRVFVFKNTGNEPLIITKAKGSCGCTVPTWPKEPIMPGESGEIKVKYATNRVGNFSKTVTLNSNAVNAPTKVVRIKGKVLPAEGEAPVLDMKGSKTN